MGETTVTSTYYRLGIEIAQVRLSKGFDYKPERAAVIYQYRYKTRFNYYQRTQFIYGYRRGRLLYWLKRAVSFSKNMRYAEMEELIRILENACHSKIRNEPVRLTGAALKMDEYMQMSETIDGLKQLNDSLIQRLHAPADVLFYEDLNAAIALGKGNRRFRIRNVDGRWGVRTGVHDENREVIEVLHDKLEIAILISVLLWSENREQML